MLLGRPVAARRSHLKSFRWFGVPLILFHFLIVSEVTWIAGSGGRAGECVCVWGIEVDFCPFVWLDQCGLWGFVFPCLCWNYVHPNYRKALLIQMGDLLHWPVCQTIELRLQKNAAAGHILMAAVSRVMHLHILHFPSQGDMLKYVKESHWKHCSPLRRQHVPC